MNRKAKDGMPGNLPGGNCRHWERAPVWPGRDTVAANDQNLPDKALSRVAQAIINVRARRAVVFGLQIGANLSDPSWDMLLELFIAHAAKRRLGATNLCLAASVSQSTALRHIAVMVDAGFVVRTADEEDSRRIMLSLSPSGVTAMRALLGPMASEFS